MYCHCKKINPSNHSRYMSNEHVTSPSGMNNGISLRRGEEIWAPPERPNYAAPPSRNFSDVSCKVHILEMELYQWCMNVLLVWVLESARISHAVSPFLLLCRSIPNPVGFGRRHTFQLQSWEREYCVSHLFASMRISHCAISVVRFWMLTCHVALYFSHRTKTWWVRKRSY
jgi:hypothetical protein